jgi:type I restriction enzyme M protein
MSTDSQQIVNKVWNFAHVLSDDGLSYIAYTEQIAFLLFLKMADDPASVLPSQTSGKSPLPPVARTGDNTIGVLRRTRSVRKSAAES